MSGYKIAKRLFFTSIFFFGVFFFIQIQVVLAAATTTTVGAVGAPCSGGAGTCQTIAACLGSVDSSSENCTVAGLICCNGPGGGSTSTGKTCTSSIDGGTGTCQTKASCGSGALGNADICTDGLGCCVGGGTLPPTAPAQQGSFYDPGSASGGVTPCDGVIRAGVCFPAGTGLSDAPVGFLLMRLMSWLLALFGMIAIIAFVISGIQYLISAGNEDMITTAKRNMQYSLIGVIVGLSGWVIIKAIDQALGGSSLLSTILSIFGF